MKEPRMRRLYMRLSLNQITMVKKLKVLSTVTSLKFKEMEIEVPELKATEVFVKIKSCGVCHTDLYSLDKPGFVAGHETVGRVLEVGKLVKHIQVGDLIGYYFADINVSSSIE